MNPPAPGTPGDELPISAWGDPSTVSSPAGDVMGGAAGDAGSGGGEGTQAGGAAGDAGGGGDETRAGGDSGAAAATREVPEIMGPTDNTGKKTNFMIGTHNGTFHCDEVFACVMLKKLPGLALADIIRTRVAALLGTCDYVVDVGGTYNHQHKRYDHHQRGFNLVMADLQPDLPFQIKLSSAGLVYAHYGKEVLREMMGEAASEGELVAVWKRVYDTLVKEVDAIDNGISQAGGELSYRIHTGLSARVGALNVGWNDHDANETEQFNKAYQLVDKEFTELVARLQSEWLPARDLVLQALMARNQGTPEQSQVIVLSTFCPWGQHLLELEEQMNVSPSIKFVVFSDMSSGTWRVRAVPAGGAADFELRVPLKESWRGLRDYQLCAASNIPGCIFVHASGFIGGNTTQQGAIAMALASIEAAAGQEHE